MNSENNNLPKKIAALKLLDRDLYTAADEYDPLRFYFWPILGRMYRKRVELCLHMCEPGQRVLDVGFGAGATFLNLNEKYKEICGIDLTADIAGVGKVFQDINIPVNLRNGNLLNMEYPDEFFDTVLLISILEHLKPNEQATAFSEIKRVLKPGGQVVYGVPIERGLSNFVFWLLRANIREHHFSTQIDVADAAKTAFKSGSIIQMKSVLPILGPVYEIGYFRKGTE